MLPLSLVHGLASLLSDMSFFQFIYLKKCKEFVKGSKYTEHSLNHLFEFDYQVRCSRQNPNLLRL